MSTRARFVLVCALALSAPVYAAEVAVPPDLQPWQSWVLHGEEFRRCPYLTGVGTTDAKGFQCAWPERLVLDLDARGGRFNQQWRVYADSWVVLPGSLEHWPRDVQVNGAGAAVVARQGVPQMRLVPGAHTIAGSFRWSSRPESLSVPSQTGIVQLTIDRQPIAQPERPGNAVWLGKRRSATEQPQMEIDVYRLVSDDIPAILTTRIRLRVAGEAREELLARVLPADFVPVRLTTALPARLEPDGRLRVQVRPGTWEIGVAARGASVAESLQRPASEGPWARDEIWSFASMDRLRVTAVEGAEAVDPVQADVPDDWRQYPSYRLAPETKFKIVERSRGLATADENRLSLQREVWLDFAHAGYTAVDLIEGQMRQGWRMDVVPPYRLMSARIGEENLLVTEGPVAGSTGIEVRSPAVYVNAVSRIEGSSGMLATGWQSRFDNVSGILNLPPGHRLLAVIGADDAPSAWIERWQLLDLFLVLIASLAIGKLLGWRWGAVALAALALTHHDAHQLVWLWLNVILAALLAREAPEGTLRKVASVYRGVAFALLVIMLIPFIANQARLAIYPQLDRDVAYGALDQAVRLDMPAATPADVPVSATEIEPALEGDAGENAPGSRALPQGMEEKLQDVVVKGSMLKRKIRERYAAGTVMQTGPGIPGWNFVRHGYHWSGPVDAAQKLRFVVMTPPWLSLWRLAGIVLLVVLLAALVRFAYGWPRQFPRIPRFGAAAALIVLSVSLLPVAGQADTPDAALLQELKSRLTRAPECAPACAEITGARVVASQGTLDIELDVSALTTVAIPIPAAEGRWEPEAISIDGQANGGLYRDAERRLWVPLRSGTHEVRLTGRIIAAESVQLVFPQLPRTIDVRGDGWEFSGVNDGRLLTNTLELVRKSGPGQATRLEASMQFPPFVRVTRRIELGIDWGIHTVVERVAPERGAFTVIVPLLTGESVLTEGIEMRADGTVLVAMPAGESGVAWQSSLARGERLELRSAGDAARVEVWTFTVSPQWSVQFEGTPEVLPAELTSGEWSYEFHPRAGEALVLEVTRPEAAEGTTLAWDAASLQTQIGKRSTSASLQLRYRSTQGGRHTLRLPADARVNSVSVDGQSIALRPQNGELAIALLPGAHALDVSWQSDAGIRIFSRAPPVDLGHAASNIQIQINVPQDRWVLYAFGPGVGPAILFWGELLVFIVVAVLLGRMPRSPLKTHEWLLLGLGLSTFSWAALFIFGAWMFVLRWRSGWTADVSTQSFNLLQVAIAILSVMALVSLLAAIPYGLLASPDMRIQGPGNHAFSLNWFVDQTSGALPQPGVLNVSLWWYKLAMLAWALWLSFALLRWLPWAWRALTANGLWRGSLRAPATRTAPASGHSVNPE
jgi:hypothetical protein